MELFNYQKQGIEFLVSKHGGMLLDEQGLGKTIQALNAVNEMAPVVWKQGKACVLVVVCPAIMQGTWRHHIENILDNRIASIVHSYEWYVKLENYNGLMKLIHNNANSVCVIVDESHYIKTPTSKRTKTVQHLLSLDNIIFKVLLTGTPVTRDVDDLYMQLKVFYPNFCRSIFEYRKKYMNCIHSYFGDVYKGFKNEYSRQEIIKYLKLCSLRRTKKSAGLNLPSIVRQPVYIDINKKIAKESLSILDYATKVINGVDDYTLYKTDLAEEASHIASIRKALGVAKVPQVLQYVEHLLQSGITKLVLFGVHVDVVNLIYESLKEKYKEIKTHRIIGATTSTQREKIIKEFQELETPQILVANMIACGVGVTLTKSHTVVFAELDFTPSNIMQAEARVHRITQEHIVNSIFMIANESLDAKILDLIKDKLKVIKDVLQTSS